MTARSGRSRGACWRYDEPRTSAPRLQTVMATLLENVLVRVARVPVGTKAVFNAEDVRRTLDAILATKISPGYIL